MSFLTTTAKLVHSSRLPPGTTRSQALAMLSDHEFFLTCDPHLDRYELFSTTEVNPPPSVPESVKSQDERSEEEEVTPTCYRVTDIVHAVPAGIWDTNVVSTYEFTDIENGLFVRIRSPLSIVMDTFWEVREVDDGNGKKGLELVEDVTIQCSRLLIGIVRG